MPSKTSTVCRLGVVSYLNAKPLIAGLERDPTVRLTFDVPSHLAPMLERGEVDVALVPVIELLRPGRNWQILSDACIACDGETLTVRVFSRVPAREIRRLHVDGDSRTSIALAKIIWRELHGRNLELVRFTGCESLDECEAVLLIGDKVVNNTLIDYDIETDLGSAWKTLTGLPFVFAAWAAPPGFDGIDIAQKLSRARDRGVAAAEMIAADYGPGLKWPVALAKRYLSKRLQFTLDDRYRKGMQRFMELARAHDLIGHAKDLVGA